MNRTQVIYSCTNNLGGAFSLGVIKLSKSLLTHILMVLHVQCCLCIRRSLVFLLVMTGFLSISRPLL